MRLSIPLFPVLVALAASGRVFADLPLATGQYEIEVRISLPNVQDVATPLLFSKCIVQADLESGQAFFILSDNPLKVCDLLDYEVTGDRAAYRVACAGPNRGSAVAAFDTKATTYRGTIKMNMGGKNMTMSETQVARKTGECP